MRVRVQGASRRRQYVAGKLTDRHFWPALVLAAVVLVVASASSVAAAAGSLQTPAVSTAGSCPGPHVNASHFGHNPTDATASLQAALDDRSARCIVVDDVGKPWVVGPLFIRRDDVTVVFETGVTLLAKPGGFPGVNDSLLTIQNYQHINLIGYGANLQMQGANSPEYQKAEWRHGIKLLSATNVFIAGLAIQDAGGDGINVADFNPSVKGSQASKNITIKDVTVESPRRNGLTVISVDGLLIEGSTFANASGTSPMMGIDFEPDYPWQSLKNVTIRDSVFAGNMILCIRPELYHLDHTSKPISITVDNILCQQNGIWPGVLVSGPQTTDPGGFVTFNNSLIVNGNYSGSASYGVTHKLPNGTRVEFNQVTVWNVGHRATSLGYRDAAAPLPPAIVESASLGNISLVLPSYGGVTWKDNVIVTDQELPFLAAYEPPTGNVGVSRLSGNFTVIDPNASGRSIDLGPNAHDNNVTVHGLNIPPATTVDVTAGVPAQCRETFTIHRSSADLSFPLAVLYQTSGTSVERYDYSGLSDVAVIPAGQTATTITVHQRQSAPHRAHRGSPPKTLTVTLEPGAPSVAGTAPGYEFLGGGRVYTVDRSTATTVLASRSNSDNCG